MTFGLVHSEWVFLRHNRAMLVLDCALCLLLILNCWLYASAGYDYSAYLSETNGCYSCEFSQIFFENLKASILLIIFGVVPLMLGTMLGMLMTIRSLAVTLKMLCSQYPLGKLILCTLPHGVVEFSALFLSFYLSSIVSKEITCAIWNRVFVNKASSLKSLLHPQGLWHSLKNVFFGVVLLVLPMLMAAAMIETRISPHAVRAILGV